MYSAHIYENESDLQQIGVKFGIESLGLLGYEVFIYGSQGRNIAEYAYRNSTNEVTPEMIQDRLKVNHLGYIEFDFACPFNTPWDLLVDTAIDVYEASQHGIVLDPHLALVRNQHLFKTPMVNNISYGLPIDEQHLIRLRTKNGSVFCFDLPTQLATLEHAQLALQYKHQAALRYYYTKYPELAEKKSGIEKMTSAQYEYLLGQTYPKPFAKTIYHSIAPAYHRGEFARKRRALLQQSPKATNSQIHKKTHDLPIPERHSTPRFL